MYIPPISALDKEDPKYRGMPINLYYADEDFIAWSKKIIHLRDVKPDISKHPQVTMFFAQQIGNDIDSQGRLRALVKKSPYLDAERGFDPLPAIMLLFKFPKPNFMERLFGTWTHKAIPNVKVFSVGLEEISYRVVLDLCFIIIQEVGYEFLFDNSEEFRFALYEATENHHK